MAKIFEAGVAKIIQETPLDDKMGPIIANLDKMSALGWEYRGMIEAAPGQMMLIYQRELVTSGTTTPPAPPATGN